MTLSIETEWLREYAKTELPTDALVELNSSALRRANITLVDLRCFFRSGLVVRSDKTTCEGSTWLVDGTDCDGQAMRATMFVHTQEFVVKIVTIERIPNPTDPRPQNEAA